MCREICYKCPFASKERVGDITIGDFHQIKQYESNVDRFAGVSMFTCNTKKGLDFFERVSSKLKISFYETQVIYQNNRFSNINECPTNRDEFLNFYATNSYESLVKHFLNYRKNIFYYYYKMPGFIRGIIKRIMRK